MHQNPELSFQEVHTTAYLTEELKKIPGLTLEFPTKTGVVAVLKGVQPGPVLALRADIDALPIQEETGLPYASTVPGVMHACGHDGHAAMQLAAAKLLAAERTSLKGEVRFLFQHAEELPPRRRGGNAEGRRDEGVDEAVRHAPELQLPYRHLRCPARGPHQRHRPLRHPGHRQGRSLRVPGDLRGPHRHRR